MYQDGLSNSKGFTLIELLVNVAIVSLLSSIALPGYQDYKGLVLDREQDMALKNLRIALEAGDSDEEQYESGYLSRWFDRKIFLGGTLSPQHENILPGFPETINPKLNAYVQFFDCSAGNLTCRQIRMLVGNCENGRVLERHFLKNQTISELERYDAWYDSLC